MRRRLMRAEKPNIMGVKENTVYLDADKEEGNAIPEHAPGSGPQKQEGGYGEIRIYYEKNPSAGRNSRRE